MAGPGWSRSARRAGGPTGLSGPGATSSGSGYLERFGYIGVFSSGVFGITGRREGGEPGSDEPTWEERQKDSLGNAELKEGLELIWFATGKEDFLIETSRVTVEMLRKHGFDVSYKETQGGHTWINWREYLIEFSQRLFR